MKTKKMNYVLVPLSLVMLLTFILVSGHAIASSPDADEMPVSEMSGSEGERPRCDDRGMRGGEGHVKMLAVALDFTAAQKAQVKKIVSANREKMKALRDQMRDAQQQLHTMMETDRFDEAAFRVQAEKAAAMRIDLMVDRVKTRHAIFAVMTAEQREKAKKLKQAMAPKRHGKKGAKGSRG